MSEPIEKMEQLKPCPWCGGTPTHKKAERFGYEVSPSVIRCRKCNFYMAHTGREADREVVEHWNHRPIEDALRAERDRAEEDNQRIRDALKLAIEQRDEARTEVAILRNECELLRSTLADNEAYGVALLHERDNARAELARADAEIVRLEVQWKDSLKTDPRPPLFAEIERLTAELAALRERGERLAEACNAAHRMMSGLDWDKVIWDEIIERLRTALAAWEGKR